MKDQVTSEEFSALNPIRYQLYRCLGVISSDTGIHRRHLDRVRFGSRFFRRSRPIGLHRVAVSANFNAGLVPLLSRLLDTQTINLLTYLAERWLESPATRPVSSDLDVSLRVMTITGALTVNEIV